MAVHRYSLPAANNLSNMEALKVLKMAATYDLRLLARAGRCQGMVQEDVRVWGKFKCLARLLTGDEAVELFQYAIRCRWVTDELPSLLQLLLHGSGLG